VVRTLIAITVRLSAASAAPTFGAFGLYMCTGDEDTAAVPSITWDPATDQTSDWLYRFVAPFPGGTAVGTLEANGGADIVIDVRAKRKIPVGAGILAVFENFGPGGGTLSVAADVRHLIISG
jgi:hypothetical protein